MTKVLLIEPPSPKEAKSLRMLGSIGTCKTNIFWPPYDLMLLGGLLRKHGVYDFDIIDANNLGMSFADLKKVIAEAGPEIVVFTTTNHSLTNDMLTAKVAKEVSKDIVTVAGGLTIPAIRNIDQVLKESKHLDVVCYNELDVPILNLIKADYNPAGIRGLHWKSGGKVIKNKPQPPEDYDSLGTPAQDKVPLHIYKDPLMKRRPMTVVCCSRGCIGSCKYCTSVFQRPVRFRSVENVLEELRLIRALGVKEIKFFDCCFLNDVNRAEKLLKRMIKEKFDFTWICDVRADRVSPKVIRLMKQAGCHTICMGGDSAVQAVLDSLGKHSTVGHVERATKIIKDAGLRLLLYFTFGHPAETRETMRKTIDWAKKLNPDMVTFGIITPVYGTEFYKYLEQKGYLDTSAKRGDYDPIKPPVYNYPHLSSDEIYEMSRKGYREFYLRPSFMAKRLFTTASLGYELDNFVLFIKRNVLSGAK